MGAFKPLWEKSKKARMTRDILNGFMNNPNLHQSSNLSHFVKQKNVYPTLKGFEQCNAKQNRHRLNRCRNEYLYLNLVKLFSIVIDQVMHNLL